MAYSTKFVNKHQTPLERRNKYRLCKRWGCSIVQARRMRDWRVKKMKSILYILAISSPMSYCQPEDEFELI